jgi:hypothetical protein
MKLSTLNIGCIFNAEGLHFLSCDVGPDVCLQHAITESDKDVNPSSDRIHQATIFSEP